MNTEMHLGRLTFDINVVQYKYEVSSDKSRPVDFLGCLKYINKLKKLILFRFVYPYWDLQCRFPLVRIMWHCKLFNCTLSPT